MQLRIIPVTVTLFALFVGLLACGEAPSGIALDPSESEEAADGRGAPAIDQPVAAGGHARMVQLLGDIAEQAQLDNPFLGLGQLPRVEQDLAALQEGRPDLRRWLFHRLIGRNLLRLGRIEEAIGQYEASYRQWELFRNEIPPKETAETFYDLGVAYLRWGETENCALRHTSASCILPIAPEAVHAKPEGSTRAMEWFMRVLEIAPPGSYEAVKARWLLNIAAMTLGRHPAGVEARYRIDLEQFGSTSPFPKFVNVAPRLGLNAFDLAGGAAIEDFDGDLDLDLVVSTSDTTQGMHYYENLGDGTFADRTQESGLSGLLGGLNLNHTDYNNDGWPDLFVLRGAWWRNLGQHPNSLLRNNGDGTFTDVTFEAGLGEVHYPTQTAAWADYDLDGDLDLYVGNEASQEIQAPSQLFRNNGDGTFTDVAQDAGVTNDRYAKAVVWGDVDEDGDPDLYVSNMPNANRLYRNNGDGTFVDVAAEAGVERPLASFPSWFWDYDSDGHLDLFVSSYGGPNIPPDVAWVAASHLGMKPPAELAKLYRGDGTGRFRDVAASAGITQVTLPMGSNLGDLDNDGHLDFYLGTGYPYYEGVMPNRMYRNDGSGGFDDVTLNGGFGHLQKGHGVVFADLDHDGDQDVFEQMGGSYPGDPFSNALFLNPGFGAKWIKLRFVGTASNRAAVGTKITLNFDEGDQQRTVVRWIGTGGSFGSNPLRQEIGLGAAAQVKSLQVEWPSGAAQSFTGLAAERFYVITEGESDPKQVDLPRIALE